VVHPHEAQHHQLPQDRAPLRGFEVGADAKRAQLLVVELLDLLCALAAQDINNVLRTE